MVVKPRYDMTILLILLLGLVIGILMTKYRDRGILEEARELREEADRAILQAHRESEAAQYALMRADSIAALLEKMTRDTTTITIYHDERKMLDTAGVAVYRDIIVRPMEEQPLY